jgi:hypothetical protein
MERDREGKTWKKIFLSRSSFSASTGGWNGEKEEETKAKEDLELDDDAISSG